MNELNEAILNIIGLLQKINKIESDRIDELIKAAKKEKTNKKELLKERSKELFQRTTMHGLPNILHSKNRFFVLIWSISLLASVCSGSYFVIDVTLDFLKYNTVTTMTVINEQSVQFPTLSFCAYPFINTTIEETIINIRFDGISEKNFSSSLEEFNDLVYGKCYRYNSGKNIYNQSVDIIHSTTSGYENGLKIDIFLKVPKEYDFAELVLNIHNHSSPPLNMYNDGIRIKPGSWNYYRIERVFNQRLGSPYSNCLKDANEFKLNKTIVDYILKENRLYLQHNCFNLCSYLFALKNSACNCKSSLNNFDKDCLRPDPYDTNVTIEMKECISTYLKKFRKESQFNKCNEYCPLECDSMSYQIENIVEQMPVSGNISVAIKDYFKYLNKFKTYEEANRNFIGLRVYYKDLKYTLISQEPKTEMFDFISKIGGIFGLFLGISFLSFVEFFEIFFVIIQILLKN